jgi:phospholipase C
MSRVSVALLAGAFVLSSCGGGAGGVGGGVPFRTRSDSRKSGTIPISHVIIMIQENRSFNNLFATFPGADGTTKGKKGKNTITLKQENLVWPCDFGHSRSGYLKDYDGGKMDGFYLEGGGKGSKCSPLAGRNPYQYVNPAQITPYWAIAGQYVLADQMFQTQGSGSFTGHQDLIRGGTTFDSALSEALVDFPTGTPWGCDAPPGTRTSMLLWTGSKMEGPRPGPSPCTNQFPGSGSYYKTLADLLDAKSLTWKYYTPSMGGAGALWNAFDMISSVRNGPEWSTNIITPEKKIFGDIRNGKLATVSWVIPDAPFSDHPGPGSGSGGPSWVASVVNAIGLSPYWGSTAIIITWDDWGGFYDQVPPPPIGSQQFDHWGGLGFRVPMMIVSPYAREAVPSKPGYISHTQYEFGSIIKFVEDIWSLGNLNTTDTRANSIIDSFDFSQPPRTFTKIPSSFSRGHFEHLPPSNLPIDSE